MLSCNATNKPWRRRIIGGVLILLGLAAIGLPNSQAQMRYSGGFIQQHRHPPPIPPGTNPPIIVLPPSYFPDNDVYYPFYSPAAPAVTRSNYPWEETGRAVPPAGALPFGVSAAILPWNQAGFEDYHPIPDKLPEAPFSAPKKNTLAATPVESPARIAETAALIVHLPRYAMVWVEGKRISLTGQTSTFHSPPLNPSKRYSYSVRAVWFEDGQWVSQTRRVPVAAGLIQALYLRPAPAAGVEKKVDAANDAASRPEKNLKR